MIAGKIIRILILRDQSVRCVYELFVPPRVAENNNFRERQRTRFFSRLLRFCSTGESEDEDVAFTNGVLDEIVESTVSQ